MSNDIAISSASSISTHQELIGKTVQSFYGAYVGRVVGIATDIDCSFEYVSVDCGSDGLKQLPFGQLVNQDDCVIYVPKWRFGSLELINKKILTLKRTRALKDMISENDSMKEDAEIIIGRYERRLEEIAKVESSILETMEARAGELEKENKKVRMVLFDATMMLRSGEIDEKEYQAIKLHTGYIAEQIGKESSEIRMIKDRLGQLTADIDGVINNSHSANAPTAHT